MVVVVVVDDVALDRAAPGGDVTPDWPSTPQATTPMTTRRSPARGRRRRRTLLRRRSATSRARSVRRSARVGKTTRWVRCLPVMGEIVRGPTTAIGAHEPGRRLDTRSDFGGWTSGVCPQRVKEDADLRPARRGAAAQVIPWWKSCQVVRTSGSSPLPVALAGQCAIGSPIGRWSMSAP